MEKTVWRWFVSSWNRMAILKTFGGQQGSDCADLGSRRKKENTTGNDLLPMRAH
jgi:hypothetical protein